MQYLVLLPFFEIADVMLEMLMVVGCWWAWAPSYGGLLHTPLANGGLGRTPHGGMDNPFLMEA